jgi:hypothetical protein
MDEYTQKEKLEIVLDIVKKLKYYSGKNGVIVDLYNDSYSFVPKFKSICNEYIKGNSSHKGHLQFLEIDKVIKYYFPINKKDDPYFIIKMS